MVCTEKTTTEILDYWKKKKTIRTLHECEVLIEKSVRRVTVVTSDAKL